MATHPTQEQLTAWSDVTVVIVTFNSAKVLPACLQSLDWADHIVVVDNNSDDNSVLVASDVCPRALVLQSPTNRGFGIACNQGADHAVGSRILFLNPDATIEGATISRLIEVQDHFDAAVAAPLLLDAKGRPELRLRRFYEFENVASDNPDDIPWGPASMAFLTGAALLWRTKDWREIGGFDPNIFLFWEDFDLCLRTAKAHKSMLLVPDAVAHHAVGASTPPTDRMRWRKEWHMTWGGLYVLAKYSGRQRAAAQAREKFRFHAKLALQALIGFRRRRLLRNIAALAAIVHFWRNPV